MRCVNKNEANLLAAIQSGFPLTSRPFQEIGLEIGLSEAEVIASLSDLSQCGIIKRMGVIVRHRELGFKANAMVVWDIPDDLVTIMGKRVGEMDFVTLCYRRRRSLPRWPYNLYCMIHGRERTEVLENLATLESCCGLEEVSKQVLFSQRRFKQQGAGYFSKQPSAAQFAS
jgi:siroheme decarboxylase